MAERLKLRAEDAQDMEVVAAVLQDAVINRTDMTFLRDEHRFALVAARFCWENCPGGECERYERVHTGVNVDGVDAVKQKGIEESAKAGALNLLTIRVEDGAIDLLFAGGGTIRLEVGDWRCQLADVGDPWPTSWRPRHPEDE